ncbi:MAG TPA: efflux RND transporter periplasmic adaptor subunit, partial [Chthoniobacteraceae bacterium]|nr:efflux RND transporter periplasmic adaptor subunit [Chthoniobacteraceae bacterium]
DAKRLQAQLASLVEGSAAGVPAGEARALMEFFRAMLNARAAGILPIGEKPAFAACVVTTRGILASSLATLAARLDAREVAVLPAPDLGADCYTIAVPVLREGDPFCWLIAQLAVANSRDLQAYVVLLQALAGFLLYREQRRFTGEIQWALERTSSLLEVFRRAAAEVDSDKAGRIAVDGLREYFGCARVHLGTRRRDGFRIRAISGVAHIDAKSPAHQPFEAAMREALLAAERIDFRAASPRTTATVAHELLQQQTGASQLTTIPFPRKRGAILLEWPANAPPGAELATVIDAGAPLLPALFDVLERARPNPLLFAASRTWQRFSENRRRAVIVGAAAVVVLLGWPFHYSIRADCRLAPTIKRVVAAPFQGTLKKSYVRPGDPVAEGQPLAAMDNRDLKLKEAELIAARERALKQRDKAMSNEGEGANFAAAQLANLEAQSIGRELDLVQRRIASLDIAAPLAGVVVSGDLRRAEGQPVQQGDVLFEVAPLDDMLLEIDVPDREISRVRASLPVRFRLEAFAAEASSSAVAKVHPQSEQREGRNVFIAEAPVLNTGRQFELRPGMRGRAAIEGDRRPLIWIIGHRLWEFVMTSLFW